MGLNAGLLWYDTETEEPVAEKMDAAVRRYYETFGSHPNTCYVNPASLPAGNGHLSNGQVKVVATSIILPDHFWLGVAEPEG
jgi:uncharacterized phage protein gp47/JayE